ncbi:hypothetical protein ACJX0J_016564, partial [Zea mays]
LLIQHYSIYKRYACNFLAVEGVEAFKNELAVEFFPLFGLFSISCITDFFKLVKGADIASFHEPDIVARKYFSKYPLLIAF